VEQAKNSLTTIFHDHADHSEQLRLAEYVLCVAVFLRNFPSLLIQSIFYHVK